MSHYHHYLQRAFSSLKQAYSHLLCVSVYFEKQSEIEQIDSIRENVNKVSDELHQFMEKLNEGD